MTRSPQPGGDGAGAAAGLTQPIKRKAPPPPKPGARPVHAPPLASTPLRPGKATASSNRGRTPATGTGDRSDQTSAESPRPRGPLSQRLDGQGQNPWRQPDRKGDPPPVTVAADTPTWRNSHPARSTIGTQRSAGDGGREADQPPPGTAPWDRRPPEHRRQAARQEGTPWDLGPDGRSGTRRLIALDLHARPPPEEISAPFSPTPAYLQSFEPQHSVGFAR